MENLKIYYSGDLHNKFTPFYFFKKKIKSKNTLILDGGDAISGSNFTFNSHEPILDEMYAAGYDAMALGNREFNYFRKILRKRISQTKFPLLCANLIDLKGNINQYLQGCLIKNINGQKIGIIGLTPVQYKSSSFWVNLSGFKFIDPVEAVLKIYENLKKEINFFIILSHSGFKEDQNLAKFLPGKNIIISAHSHIILDSPYSIDENLIFSAGAYGKYLGEILINSKEIKHSLIPLKSWFDAHSPLNNNWSIGYL